MKVFIDTNIPMYAASKEHHFKASCVEILRSVAAGHLNAFTDTEVFQEIMYRYFSINQRDFGLRVFDSFSKIMDGSVLAIEHQDMLLARKLISNPTYSALSPRDTIHLAVMLNHRIKRIITADRGFENIHGIQVIYPGEGF
ncbi:type II toxin-antitoxin system VapC family toxin [Dethiobacter alkaliphilus]|uniref:PilT protein domain protein n=1 Tax=Dethiobacter alkaliphilus AHT 1 TaxID=555088 RepID=C0GK85_DETAL|nr:type II toxin-antitoxin system VapC family toxin [Dethiobacter alkaliphilus]EEG76268.1 PilT protein domain protein [Dethiobacter alkaliphilus AHT 1]